MPTNIDEEKITGKTPLETIQLRAKLKGEEALKKIIQTKPYTLTPKPFLILAADTEVVFNNQLIGKPKDIEDGKRILNLLSGKSHEVITAFSIIRLTLRPKTGSDPKTYSNFGRSLVTFRKLKDEEIDRYLQLTDYTRYTGGYALLASPQDFVIRTEGSLSNIIGLPLEKVIPILRENRLLD